MLSATKQMRLAEYKNEISAFINLHNQPDEKQIIVQQCLKVMSEKKLRDCLEIARNLAHFGFQEINKHPEIYPEWVCDLVVANECGIEILRWKYESEMKWKKWELEHQESITGSPL